jgi:hypothetical protein
MFKVFKTNIDTDTHGNIVKLDHNLGGQPFVFISEATLFGDVKYVSIYDPRISSIETKGSNSIIVSFAQSFKGTISLLLVTSSLLDFDQKLTDLDRRTKDIILQQKQLTPHTQFDKITSLLESRLDSIDKKFAELSAELRSLKSDIESL